jgi:microcystin-dependent protein
MTDNSVLLLDKYFNTQIQPIRDLATTINAIQNNTFQFTNDLVVKGNINLNNWTISATGNSDLNIINSKNLFQFSNLLLPSKSIYSWNSIIIPDGFLLCDGTPPTPDLTGKFILGGTTSTTNLFTSDGSQNITLTANMLPIHNHTVSFAPNGQLLTTQLMGNGNKIQSNICYGAHHVNSDRVYTHIFPTIYRNPFSSKDTNTTTTNNPTTPYSQPMSLADEMQNATANNMVVTANATYDLPFTNITTNSTINIMPQFHVLIYIMKK